MNILKLKEEKSKLELEKTFIKLEIALIEFQIETEKLKEIINERK